MAPIALKDKRIEGLTKQLVKRFISGELSQKNVPVALQFALSNFRYHKFLDVDSNKVEKTIKGLCEKFSIHGQGQKAKALTELCEKFVNGPLFGETQVNKSDAHYSLLKLLTTLSDSPVNAVYNQQLTQEPEAVTDNFNWTRYLLDGEEKYIIHYHDTYDEEWTDSDEDEDEIENGGLKVEKDKNEILDEHRPLAEDKSHLENNGGITECMSVEMETVRKYCLKRNLNQGHRFDMFREFLTSHVVEAYWLPDEGCLSPEELPMTEITLASQWALYSQECEPLSVIGATQRLHEIQLVRETIWMLSGVKELYVYNFVNERFEIREEIEMTHMTKVSLHKFLETFTDTATSIVEIRFFIKSVSEQSTQDKIPLTFQAFGFAVLGYLKEFNEHLSAIEELIIKKKEAVTLSMLQHRVSRYQKEIAEIYNIYSFGIKNVEKTENFEKVACFLNAFYRSILLADTAGEYGRWKVEVLLPIFLKSLSPYVEFLDGCLTEGKLLDGSNEFCIERHQRNNKLQVNDNLFNGKHVSASLCHLQYRRVPNITHQSPEIWKTAIRIKGETSLERDSSCPSFLDPVFQEIVLAGKSIILLESLGELSKNADVRLQEESLHELFIRSVSGLSNTKSVAELFYHCLYPHIRAKYRKACSFLIRLLKREFMLLDHLAAVRNFFFLEAVDAMHHFYTDIFRKCNRRECWQDMSYLNSLFQEALLPGYSSVQERFTVGYNKQTKVTPESFEGLELNYEAPWPVDLVIDPGSQKKYNDVFLFLLNVKRAKWSLDDLHFRDLEDKAILSESENEQEAILTDDKHPGDHLSQHQMHLLRYDLMQFVNGLHQYIMTRILHSKIEFEEALVKATDLDEIIKAHSLYIERVLERCLMTNKVEVMKVGILKVLRLAVKFNKVWTFNIKKNRDDIISSIGDDLKKWRTFIVTFLTKQIKQGSYPHLEALAFSLGSRKTISGLES